jgi:TPR repeat protein
MRRFKKIIAFCACFIVAQSFGQTVKSYLIVRASKYAVTNVVINSSQTLDIDAGSSKIIPVEPGYYTVAFSTKSGYMFDTAFSVVDHSEILAKNPKQTSVRYLINPPDKQPVVVKAEPKNVVQNIVATKPKTNAQTTASQNIIAKLKFEDAQDAYNNQDYATALTKLEDAERLLGQTNAKLLYLRIMVKSKLLINQFDINLEEIALLRDNCNQYFTQKDITTEQESKYKDVYLVLEVFKDYEPFDNIVKGAKAGNAKNMVALAEAYRYVFNIPKAKEWLQLAAQKQEASAFINLGLIAENGDVLHDVKPDYIKAMNYYLEGNKKNDPNTLYFTGRSYYYGIGVTKDTVVAAQWFDKSFTAALKSAQAGNVEMMDFLGDLYSNNAVKKVDYVQAFNWYTNASEKGNTSSFASIAYMYNVGNGVSKSWEKAVANYETAISKGYFWSLTNIAGLYKQKDYRDDKKALAWYLKAAEKNYTYAMQVLGDTYLYGTGVTSDYAIALAWYTKAANRKSYYAMNQIGDIYYNGWGVTQSYAIAKDWYTKAADKENLLGYQNLGVLYFYGKGVTLNYTIALEWFLKAAEKNRVRSMEWVADTYRFGFKDYENAIKWYKKAMDNDNIASIAALGFMNFDGQGVRRDYGKAFEYFIKAAEKGNVEAMGKLVIMYAEGYGVAKNKSLSQAWQVKYDAAKAKK